MLVKHLITPLRCAGCNEIIKAGLFCPACYSDVTNFNPPPVNGYEFNSDAAVNLHLLHESGDGDTSTDEVGAERMKRFIEAYPNGKHRRRHTSMGMTLRRLNKGLAGF